jgi:hypothetical protein
MGRILVRGEYGHDIVDSLQPQPGEPVVDKPGKGRSTRRTWTRSSRRAGSRTCSSAASPPKSASTRRSARRTIVATSASSSRTAWPRTSQSSSEWRWR